jgi:hypothetical protein
VNTDMENPPVVADYAQEDGTIWWADAQQVMLRALGNSIDVNAFPSARELRENLEHFSEQIVSSISYFDPVHFELEDDYSIRRLDGSELSFKLESFGHEFVLAALKYTVGEDPFDDSELVDLVLARDAGFLRRLMEFHMRDGLVEQFRHSVMLGICSAALANKFQDWEPPTINAVEDQHSYPMPAPQPYGVSHLGAEALVRDWMLHLGMISAEVTRQSGDGGIDVSAHGHVAQVKNYRDQVGVQSIRELLGVAVVEGKKPLFFTSGSYTAEAAAFADKAEIPLFIYDAAAGTLRNVNTAAEQVYRQRNNVSPEEILADIQSTLWIYRYSALILQGVCSTSSRVLNTMFPGSESEVAAIKSSLDPVIETISETHDSWSVDDETTELAALIERLESARQRFNLLADIHIRILNVSGLNPEA